MTVSREEHYVVKVEVIKVTNFTETTAYGSGSRPSGYKKEELPKDRQHHSIASIVTTQPSAVRAISSAVGQLNLILEDQVHEEEQRAKGS